MQACPPEAWKGMWVEAQAGLPAEACAGVCVGTAYCHFGPYEYGELSFVEVKRLLDL